MKCRVTQEVGASRSSLINDCIPDDRTFFDQTFYQYFDVIGPSGGPGRDEPHFAHDDFGANGHTTDEDQ
jgi:hypothetical protein